MWWRVYKYFSTERFPPRKHISFFCNTCYFSQAICTSKHSAYCFNSTADLHAELHKLPNIISSWLQISFHGIWDFSENHYTMRQGSPVHGFFGFFVGGGGGGLFVLCVCITIIIFYFKCKPTTFPSGKMFFTQSQIPLSIIHMDIITGLKWDLIKSAFDVIQQNYKIQH